PPGRPGEPIKSSSHASPRCRSLHVSPPSTIPTAPPPCHASRDRLVKLGKLQNVEYPGPPANLSAVGCGVASNRTEERGAIGLRSGFEPGGRRGQEQGGGRAVGGDAHRRDGRGSELGGVAVLGVGARLRAGAEGFETPPFLRPDEPAE